MATRRRSTAGVPAEEYPMEVGLSSRAEDLNCSSNKPGRVFDNGKEVESGSVEEVPSQSSGDVEGSDKIIHHPGNKTDVLTHTIHLSDDPNTPALTFRTWFLGIGLALFGGTISAIYYFKPQTILVSVVFLAVIAYLLGESLSVIIPRKGVIGRLLNPHPFTIKEHLAIVVMANAASISAIGIELLAVERLYYGAKLNGAQSVFLLFSSQFLGYGLAGLMRTVLVYPKNMLWPSNLPVNNMLETLHFNKTETRKPLKVFLIVFACIFFWEIVPEWIFPLLTGFSIFCLARPDSATFTNIFGGASGNEGLGLFSWSMDWQYISSGTSPLYFPMEALISMGFGTCLCIFLYSGLYYMNVWNAQNYPFLSQVLFSRSSTADNPIQWNQTTVIGTDNKIDPVALATEGLPALAASNAVSFLLMNMAITAGIVHLLLYHWREMKPAWEIMTPHNIIQIINPRTWNLFSQGEHNGHPEPKEHYDPHYRLMLKYKAVPNWWFAVILLLSIVVGLIILYVGDSTLPWWGFLISILLASVFTLFFGAMQAVTGVAMIIQPIVQLVGGFIQPGNPVANMYFTLYGYNSFVQGALLCSDLKLAQYGHLAPRVTFLMQMLGTLIGAVLNYVMMNSIVDNQAPILLSVEGTNIWSGQNVQNYNTLAVAWGGLAHELFSVGGEYQWCTLVIILGFFAPLPLYALHRVFPKAGFDNINTSVLIYFGSYLGVGINASVMNFFLIGLFSQWYLRKRYPNLFVRYNYLISAALDGGTSVITTFLTLQDYRPPRRSHLLLLPTRSKGFGPNLTPNLIVDFVNGGSNVLLALSAEQGIPSAVSSLLLELDISLPPDRNSLVDHFNYDTQSAGEGHDVLLLPSSSSNTQKGVKNFFSVNGLIALPHSVGQVLGNVLPLLASVLNAPSTAYAYNPKDDSSEGLEDVFATGEQMNLISAFQARNSARFTVLGSAEALENRWFDASVSLPGKDSKAAKIANKAFAHALSAWTFKEVGVLKVNSITHYLNEDTKAGITNSTAVSAAPGDINPRVYRIKNEVHYSASVSEWAGDHWIPFTPPEGDNVQVEFSMLSPFHRLNLEPTPDSANNATYFEADFVLPDQHGIFNFYLQYQRPF